MGRLLSNVARYRIGPVRAIGLAAALGVWISAFYVLRAAFPFQPRAVLEAAEPQGVISYSPDSRTLLTCTRQPDDLSDVPRGPLRLWDTATGRQVDEFFSPAEDISYAAITGDGRWLVIEEYSKPAIRIFDLQTHAELAALDAPPDADDRFRFHLSPGSPILAYVAVESGQRVLRIVEIPSQRRIADIPGIAHFDRLCIAFTADGASLATVESVSEPENGEKEFEIVIRETHTGAERARLHGLEGVPIDLRFTADGRRLAATCDVRQSPQGHVELRVWDLPSQQLILFMEDSFGAAFVDDDRAVVTKPGREIIHIELDTDAKPRRLYTFSGDTVWVDLPVAGANGSSVLVSSSRSIYNPILAKLDDWLRFTNLGHTYPSSTFLLDISDGSTQPVPSASNPSPDRRTVTGERGGKIILYDLPPPSRAPRAALWASVLAAAVLYATNRSWRRRGTSKTFDAA